MRFVRCLGVGRAHADETAFKQQQIERQREEALEFKDEIQREAEALIARLKAQARLRGRGFDDGHPRSSH